eukprot:m.195517 g.195517  ORF g.195517 m.195517 type:complete len:103 (-) comp13668_c0_seq4:2012-2320(-)
MHSFVVVENTFAVLSREDDENIFPSKEKSTLRTGFPCAETVSSSDILGATTPPSSLRLLLFFSSSLLSSSLLHFLLVELQLQSWRLRPTLTKFSTQRRWTVM